MGMRAIVGIALAAVVVGAAVWVARGSMAGQTSAARAGAQTTSWGEPDLQGIWTIETDTPVQRSARFADKETFTDEERARLDKERSALLGRDKRLERGTEQDVAGAYNAVFNTVRRTGKRTSLVVDPPDGRIPPQTAEAQQRAAEDRAFRVSLLQATDTCKNKAPACAGGRYDPAPSPRLADLPPRYNTGRMNRHDTPEDGSLGDRCLSGTIPDLPTAFGGNFLRIVQTPGGISIYYDTGQGQGFQRNIVMDGRAHLPSTIRQTLGDSRGHWEGNTLVIDVTNFSPKTDFFGSRENKHLIERWTRTSPSAIEYAVTVEDPTVWTRPWTMKIEYNKQSDEQNRVYYEPRCHEGNYAFPALMLAARLAEKDYAAGRGPRPDTKDNATDFVGGEGNPLQ